MCHARQSTIGDPEGQSETAVRRAIPAAVAAAAVDRFTDQLPAGLQEKALRLLQEPDGDLKLCLQRICSLCGFRANVADMPPMFLLEAVDPC